MELRWTHEAAADLERVADYLFEHTPERAERLMRALYDAPATLLTFPNRVRPGKKEGTRELVMSPLAVHRGLHGARRSRLRRSHPARGAAVAVIGRGVRLVQPGAKRHGKRRHPDAVNFSTCLS